MLCQSVHLRPDFPSDCALTHCEMAHYQLGGGNVDARQIALLVLNGGKDDTFDVGDPLSCAGAVESQDLVSSTACARSADVPSVGCGVGAAFH